MATTRKTTTTDEATTAGEGIVGSLNQPAAPNRDADIKAAHQAELDRQQAVTEAVAAAHADELPKLGGPEPNPGNPDQAEGDKA